MEEEQVRGVNVTFESLHLYNEIIGNDGINFGFEQRGSLYLCNTKKALDELVEKMGQLQTVGIETELLDQVQTPHPSATQEV
mgnify:CR=1 FL=1